jgi:capsular polysaccharide biosynthesis protein
MKFLSSKIFLILISFLIGVVVGWFLWFLVYPNLHVSGSQVWTGSSNNSSNSNKTNATPTYNNGSYNTPSSNTPSNSTSY